MALVPSGRVRIMEAQSLSPHKTGIDSGLPEPSPRSQIEQQPVAPANAEPKVEPQSQPASTQPQPEATQTPEVPQTPEQPEQPVTDNQPKPDVSGEEKGQKASPLKSYVFEVLEQAGAKRAKMDELDKKNKMFDSEIDYDRKRRGWFIIPTFTAKGEIDENKAYQIAQNIANKFQLMFKLKINGRNWKVEFASMQEEKNTADGSSLDDLDGSTEQSQGRKVAFTMGELLTARKEELYNKMRKIANKE